MLEVEYAKQEDIPFFKKMDSQLPQAELLLKIRENRCYVLKNEGRPIGVMRYNLFWDLIPFLTHIYFDEAFRGKGFGTKAMKWWENEMGLKGYQLVMTSTMVEEGAQHFYRKLGYKDCGCLIKDFAPYIETMEMFMMKKL